MAKYIKKPILIDAWIWDESKTTLKQIGCRTMSSDGHADLPDWAHNIRILTKNGTIGVEKGDYIIKNENGLYSVRSAEAFKKLYIEV